MDGVDCCIVGGGPAGMMLGLLLARSGVEVLVLEKHGDFLRDFRGDTVHPATLRLLDELGLADSFVALPHQQVTRLGVTTDDGTYRLADFARLPGKFPFLTFVPQWDLLDFLAVAASRYPTFTLRMHAEVISLLRDGQAVVGVRYRATDGREHEVRAAWTVAADGRDSVVRAQTGLRVRHFGAPMDVLWFRLPKPPTAPVSAWSAVGRLTRGRLLVLIDRDRYWQSAYLVPKGGYGALRAAGLDAFRAELARLLPNLAPTLEGIEDWDDVRVLSVRIDRLTSWHRPGLLFMGDAAHAMSPIAGVGINLAIQDAAAAARLLVEPLRHCTIRVGHLARVRRRRWLPTALTQLIQRQIQQRFLVRVLAGVKPVPTPLLLRALNRAPALQGWPARLIGLGPLPEHAPAPAPPTSAQRGEPVTILDRSSGPVIGIRITGKLSSDDYRRTLRPAFREAIAEYDRIRLLFLADDFEGWRDPLSLLADLTTTLQVRRHLERVACVCAPGWKQHLTQLSTPFIHGWPAHFPHNRKKRHGGGFVHHKDSKRSRRTLDLACYCDGRRRAARALAT